MRRLLAVPLLLAVLVVALVLALVVDGDDDTYRVRAVFDNAASVVPGEDVKIAGAKVGVIGSMDVTPDKKAAITLEIEDARFAPFRADASCTIRPQSLIGEKFVECEPGTARQARLARIERGAGEGEHLLPVESTSAPVDLDLIQNVMRRPYRERFAILLNEFGTGLAGRGDDLEQVIRRANPALRETDEVLAILARQNRTIARLARDSDRALAPLARERERVSGFITQAGRTAEATAARSGDIEAGIQRLPRFLAELEPLMADLDGFASAATPVARDLNASGDDVSRMIRELGPFSGAATTSLTTLGDAAERGRPALIRTRPLLRDLGDFASQARPVSRDLDALTASLDDTGGIERLMDLIFFSSLSINGFDQIGHYLRAGLVVNLCTNYAIEPAGGCESNFTTTRAVNSARSASNEPDDLQANLADDPAGGPTRGSVEAGEGLLDGLLGFSGPRNEGAERIRQRAGQPSPALRGPAATPGSQTGDPATTGALDYLLGAEQR